MHKNWSDSAWEEYIAWQTKDIKLLKRINQLIRDAEREPFRGIGRPEPLKGNWSGWWSGRIDDDNRLIYRVRNGILEIAQCGTHYGDK